MAKTSTTLKEALAEAKKALSDNRKAARELREACRVEVLRKRKTRQAR